MKSKIEKLGKVSITVEKEEHTSEKAYNRLVIVTSSEEGGTYISRKAVPAGIAITNEVYWKKLLSGAGYDIRDLIPEEASSTNKLADKNYVNNGISTATADFKGTFNSLEALQQVTNANANDYGFVKATDSAGNTIYKRYKYVEGTGWQWEYDINNSNFTSAQWNAINSTITAALVTKLTNLPNSTDIGNISSLETVIKTSIVAAINEVNTIAKNDINKIIIKFGYHAAILELYSTFVERELDFDDYVAYWQGTLNNINYILYARTLAGSDVPPKDSILIVTSTTTTTSLQIVELEATSTPEELYNEIYSQ